MLGIHEKTETVKVKGNCGMCKARIERSLKIEGVSNADWNKDTKILTVTYDTHKTDMDKIQNVVAGAGHDTEKYAATNDTYRKLPGCCRYERGQSNTKPN